MRIISGNSNLPLAKDICKHLDMVLTEATVKRFSDKEIFVEIHENLRGKDVFLIQPTSFPANDHIMELLIMLDAVRRSSARRITAVIPYMGYARQDRKSCPRTPISAKLIANLITASGADRVLTVDLHADQIQGFFDIPLDNLYTIPVFKRDIEKSFISNDLAVISPDIGGVVRARSLAKRINAGLAIIDKRRLAPGISEVMNVIGEVEGKECIIFDDIADSAGTLCNSALAIKEQGAKSVSAYISHGVFSGEALNRIRNSELKQVTITNSICPTEQVLNTSNIKVLSIAPLLAEAIKRIAEESSVSSLFD